MIGITSLALCCLSSWCSTWWTVMLAPMLWGIIKCLAYCWVLLLPLLMHSSQCYWKAGFSISVSEMWRLRLRKEDRKCQNQDSNPSLLVSKAYVPTHSRLLLSYKKSCSVKGHHLFVVSIIISPANKFDITRFGELLRNHLAQASSFCWLRIWGSSPCPWSSSWPMVVRCKFGTGQLTLDLTLFPPHHIGGKVKIGIT